MWEPGKNSFLCGILLEGIKLWPSTKLRQKMFLTPDFIFKNVIPLRLSSPSHTAADSHCPFFGADIIRLSECSCIETQPIRTRPMIEETHYLGQHMNIQHMLKVKPVCECCSKPRPRDRKYPIPSVLYSNIITRTQTPQAGKAALWESTPTILLQPN